MNIIQKRWFHGTTKENYKKIKKSGLKSGTFLARNLEDLWFFFTHSFPTNGDMHMRYELILSVRYESDEKNWEIITNKEIPIENIKVQFYI